MEIFRKIQINFGLFGVTQSDAFNIKTFLWIPMFGLSIILHILFVVQEANTFIEYTSSIYVISGIVGIVTGFSTIAFRTGIFFQCIKSCENIMSKSEWLIFLPKRYPTKIISRKKYSLLGLEYPISKAIYEETNRQVEKWNEIINFIMAKMTPIVLVWPSFILSFFRYFTTDLGNGAFELMLPIW